MTRFPSAGVNDRAIRSPPCSSKLTRAWTNAAPGEPDDGAEACGKGVGAPREPSMLKILGPGDSTGFGAAGVVTPVDVVSPHAQASRLAARIAIRRGGTALRTPAAALAVSTP